jgi:hypothetical protein
MEQKKGELELIRAKNIKDLIQKYLVQGLTKKI